MELVPFVGNQVGAPNVNPFDFVRALDTFRRFNDRVYQAIDYLNPYRDQFNQKITDDIKQQNLKNTKKAQLKMPRGRYSLRTKRKFGRSRSRRKFRRRVRPRLRRSVGVMQLGNSIVRNAHSFDLKKIQAFNRYFQSTANGLAFGINECKYESHLFPTHTTLKFIADIGYRQSTAAGTAHTKYDLDSDEMARLYMKCQAIGRFKNNHGLPLYLIVYEIVAKTTDEDLPEAMITRGLDDYADADAGYEVSTLFYPNQAREFTENYKILKTHKKQLAPGEEVSYKMHLPGVVVRPKGIEQLKPVGMTGTDFVSIGGVTRGFLIRAMGTIAHDAESETSVGYCNGQIDQVFEYKYTYGWVGGLERRVVTVSAGVDTMTNVEAANVAQGGVPESGDM